MGSVTKYLECFSEIQLEGMSSGSGEVLSSLRGKIIELPESKEKEEWTPFNGEMHMQGIKVIVNNPTPTKTKVDTFEDTLFLMEIAKHKIRLEKYEKKEKMIQDMAMEQKRKKEQAKGKAVNYIR